jgi:hypothetical protein
LETTEECKDGGSLAHLPDSVAGGPDFTGNAACQGGIQIQFDFHVRQFPLPQEKPAIFYTFFLRFSSFFPKGFLYKFCIDKKYKIIILHIIDFTQKKELIMRLRFFAVLIPALLVLAFSCHSWAAG